MYNRLLLVAILIGFASVSTKAQTVEENDTIKKKDAGLISSVVDYAENTIFQYLQKSNQTASEKPFNFSIIGGPYYTNETKVGLELIGSGLFRLRGCETDSLPSDVSLYTNATTSGAYAVGIQSNIYFPKKIYWITASATFSNTPSRYWGIGYEDGKNAGYTKYNLQQIQVNVAFYKQMARYSSLGVLINSLNIKGKNFKKFDMLDGENPRTNVIGAGLTWAYDSRDVPNNAYRGMYAMVAHTLYPGFMGTTSSLNKSQLTFRYYKQFTPGTVLAYDLNGTFQFGNVPWSLMALAGNASQMRGYYTGQYRDKNFVNTQVELRQHVYKRSGIAIWGGFGNVFSKAKSFDLDKTLFTTGVGYRFRLKDRTNLRVDYGIGKGQSAFYININEAF